MNRFPPARPRSPVGTSRFLLLSLISIISGVGCSETATQDDDDDEKECPLGSLGCDCTAEATCSAPLLCEAGTCTEEDSPLPGAGGTNLGPGSGGGPDELPGSGGSGDLGTGGSETNTLTFTFTSSELAEGGEFMTKHTCQGSGFDADESPPFSIAGAPEGTLSFALTFIDRTLVDEDAASPFGYHWALTNIEATVTEIPGNLPAGTTLTSPISATQSRASYLGPCPYYGESSPQGDPHVYEFTLYALSTATAPVSGPINAAMLSTLEAAALDTVTLKGTSSAFDL